MDEFLAKFDDNHQDHFYAVSVLDGDGEADRRAARICNSNNTTAMNAVRMHGKDVEERFYRSEDDYMPLHWKADRRRRGQSWDEMKSNLGFS